MRVWNGDQRNGDDKMQLEDNTTGAGSSPNDRTADSEAKPNKLLFPVIKLGEKMTYAPWEIIPTDSVIIKASDIFQSNGLSWRPIVKDVINAGGIHPYFEFNKNIVLSSVMPDKTLYGITKEEYARAINELGFDGYFTPDGETYLGEWHLSRYEINRMLYETEYLLKACPDKKPFGLVKGCNAKQVKDHAERLNKLGIESMVFHAGDFIRGGKWTEIQLARVFASVIRKEARTFFIYGVGSRKMLLTFSDADGFMTQNHIINALYRQTMENGKWVDSGKKAARVDMMGILRKIYEEVCYIGNPTGLDMRQKVL